MKSMNGRNMPEHYMATFLYDNIVQKGRRFLFLQYLFCGILSYGYAIFKKLLPLVRRSQKRIFLIYDYVRFQKILFCDLLNKRGESIF